MKVSIANWLGGKKKEKGSHEKRDAQLGHKPEQQNNPRGSLQKENLVLVGSDVEALYPSMDPHRTGEVVRQETEKVKSSGRGLTGMKH